MSRCTGCQYATHEQFKGHQGRWLCYHPYRYEIDNKGDFTYPGNFVPHITICETPVADYDQTSKHTETLAAVKTPVWCYYEVVERTQKVQPNFDPDKQRAILWPKDER